MGPSLMTPLHIAQPEGKPIYRAASPVSAPPSPSSQKPDALTAGSTSAAGTVPQPPYACERVVKGLLDQVSGEVKAVLDQATLRAAVTDEDGTRKIGYFAARGLESARKSAEKSFLALDSFTGKDLADAIGSANAGSKADKAVRQAIQDQFDLANKLRRASMDAGGIPALDELAHQADLRGCEIGRLVTELHQLACQRDATDERLTANGVVAKEGKLAMSANATRTALEVLERQIKPHLDRFLQTLNQVESSPMRLTDAANALASIRGILASAHDGVQVGSGGTSVHLDNRVLVALEAKVAEYDRRLEEAVSIETDKAATVRQIALRFADECILPKIDDIVWPDEENLLMLRTWYDKAREAVMRFAEGVATRQEVDGVIGELQTSKLKTFCDGFCDPFDQTALDKFSDADKPKIEELRSRIAILGNDKNPNVISGAFKHQIECLTQILARGQSLAFQVADARLVMQRGMSFTRVAELRLHGYGSSDAEPLRDVASSVEEIGSDRGMMNAVKMLAYKDEQGHTLGRRIFKPEMAARNGLGNMDTLGVFQSFITAETQALDFNMATYEVSSSIGCGDVVVRASAEIHNGEFGMSLEEARGGSIAHMVKGDVKDADCATLQDLAAMDKGTLLSVKGKVAQQLNRLQWADLVTGQIDRHDGNYFVFISRDGKTVEVKGFDADASFPDKIVGIGRHVVSRADVEAFVQSYRNDHSLSGPALEATPEWKQLVADGCLVGLDDGRYQLNTTKMDAYGRSVSANMIELAKHYSRFPPDCMDRQAYQGIVAMTQDGPGYAKFRAIMAKHNLTPEQIEAAVGRLKDARECADYLKLQGRVFDDGDWGNEDLLDALGQNLEGKELCDAYTKKHPGLTPNQLRTMSQRIDLTTQSYFARGHMDDVSRRTMADRNYPLGIQALFDEVDRLTEK